MKQDTALIIVIKTHYDKCPILVHSRLNATPKNTHF